MSYANVVTTFNNFSRAQVDLDLDGRFDLPVYQNGAKVFRNFISNFKGNAIYRTGFERMLDFQDCGLMEFRFNENQNYLLGLYNTKMRFASYAAGNVFGWVLDGASAILEVNTPYTLAESKNITGRKAFTQNFDSIIVTHKDHEPRELKRLSANSFRFTTYSRKDDPFPTAWATTKSISNVTKATEAVFTITGHGYSVNDRFKVASVGGMTEINGWTAAVIEVIDANTVKTDIDSTDFTAHSGSSGTAAKVTAGDYPHTCLYYKGRLWYGGSRTKITTVWASEDGQFKVHTLPTTVLPESALQFTLAELDAQIEWMMRGSNSLILGTKNDVVAIHGGSVGEAITAETIDSTPTDADGTNNAEPIAKDGQIFYITNDGRRVNYFGYDLLSETFGADDANVVAFDITKSGLNKLRHVKNREDLIFAKRADGVLLSCNFNKKEKIIGWHEHPSYGVLQDVATISDNDGVQQLFALMKYGSNYFIERQAPYKEFSKRSSKAFFTALSDAATRAEWQAQKIVDDEAFYRKLAEEFKECIHLDNANIYQDLRTATITYDAGAGTITAGSASFSSGDVGRHIVYKTKTGYESGRFEITGYNSTTSVDVEVLQAPTATVYDSWYLSFNAVTGLSRFNGTEIAVVADGGFLDTFTVSGGAIDLETEATSVVYGYKYDGVIESFPLGFASQGENTQGTMKVISRVGLRFLNTAGGKFGASRYALDEVQQLKQDDLNYLPPNPMNGTVFVEYSDDHQVDRGFTVVQDVPLPMQITAVMVDASYAVTR